MSVTLLLLAVCVSAFVAHQAIDIVGDFALPHDTYDDIGHSSRIGTLVGALVFVLVASFRMLGAALSKAHGDRSALGVFRSLIKSPLRFTCAVAVLSVFAVAGMEWSDAFMSGGDLDGIDDAFGGSLPLGLSLTLLVAAAVSCAVVKFARVLESPCELVVAFLRILAARPRDHAVDSIVGFAALEIAPRRRFSVHARRAPKRGPPLLAA
jgi:hypothetical protein